MGNSTLKNPSGFYKNLARWIHAFRMGNDPVETVNIDLQRANALSVKWIGYIIDDIEKHPSLKKGKVKINWIYPLKENLFPVSSGIYKSLTCVRLKIVAA